MTATFAGLTFVARVPVYSSGTWTGAPHATSLVMGSAIAIARLPPSARFQARETPTCLQSY
jgi:hypothetical protein